MFEQANHCPAKCGFNLWPADWNNYLLQGAAEAEAGARDRIPTSSGTTIELMITFDFFFKASLSKPDENTMSPLAGLLTEQSDRALQRTPASEVLLFCRLQSVLLRLALNLTSRLSMADSLLGKLSGRHNHPKRRRMQRRRRRTAWLAT